VPIKSSPSNLNLCILFQVSFHYCTTAIKQDAAGRNRYTHGTMQTRLFPPWEKFPSLEAPVHLRVASDSTTNSFRRCTLIDSHIVSSRGHFHPCCSNRVTGIASTQDAQHASVNFICEPFGDARAELYLLEVVRRPASRCCPANFEPVSDQALSFSSACGAQSAVRPSLPPVHFHVKFAYLQDFSVSTISFH
jgi:hypothetical protein